LVSKKEIEEQLKKGTAKELKGYRDAKKNALFSALIGEWVTFADEHKVSTVLLNQTRYAMNVLFGDNQTSNADNILQYYVTLRLRGKIVGKIKSKINDSKIVGVKTEWETIKNRNVYPYKKAVTSILFKSGLSKYSGLRELLINEGIGSNVSRKPKCIKYGKKVYPINKLVNKRPEILDLRDM
jgi:RecA/RadA recombinase